MDSYLHRIIINNSNNYNEYLIVKLSIMYKIKMSRKKENKEFEIIELDN